MRLTATHQAIQAISLKNTHPTRAAAALHLIRHVRQERRRRQLYRNLGSDPTTAIGSPTAAMQVAETLLAAIPPRRDGGEQLWASVAVLPLGALLFGASRQQNAAGIDWVHQALTTVDAEARVSRWQQAAQMCGQPGHAPACGFGDSLLRLATWEPRQQESVIHVMRAALAPWAAGTEGERLAVHHPRRRDR